MLAVMSNRLSDPERPSAWQRTKPSPTAAISSGGGVEIGVEADGRILPRRPPAIVGDVARRKAVRGHGQGDVVEPAAVLEPVPDRRYRRSVTFGVRILAAHFVLAQEADGRIVATGSVFGRGAWGISSQPNRSRRPAAAKDEVTVGGGRAAVLADLRAPELQRTALPQQPVGHLALGLGQGADVADRHADRIAQALGLGQQRLHHDPQRVTTPVGAPAGQHQSGSRRCGPGRGARWA